MKYALPTLLLLSFLFFGCSGSSPKKPFEFETAPGITENNITETGDSETNPEPGEEERRIPYECPATIESEKRFRDTFITGSSENILYAPALITRPLSVTEIEQLFNRAHRSDPTVSEDIVLPDQTIWDQMDSSAKTLYLVNWERCARGIRLYEGIDPLLAEDVTKPYALYLTSHEESFILHPHDADGKGTKVRMEEAGIVLGETSEYYAENITLISTSNDRHYDDIFEPEALAVYSWLYQDRDANYGHREFVLSTGFVENTGKAHREGLIAAYTAKKRYVDQNGFYWTKSYTVMDGFDPLPAWKSQPRYVTLYTKVAH